MVLALGRWFAGMSHRKPVRRTQRGRWAVTRLEDRTVPANVAFAAAAFAGPNTAMTVNVYGPTGTQVASFVPFSDFVGGNVNIAIGDVNGDGTQDVIVAPGNGGGPIVNVYDGAALPGVTRPLFQLVAYDPLLRGGTFVAAGDINGDGKADVITGAGLGGGPHVKAFSGADNGATLLLSFFAYEGTFRGGVRVGASDFGGDNGQNPNGTFRPGGAPGSHNGDAEIVTAPGPGRLVDLELWDYDAQLNDPDHFGTIISDQTFPGFTGGAFVGGGFFTNNVDSDGFVYADITVSADVTGGPQEKMFRLDAFTDPARRDVAVYIPANQVVAGDPAVVDPNYPLTSTFPFDTGLRGGLRIGTVKDLNGDGRDELIVGPGPQGGPQVRVLSGLNGTDLVPTFLAGDPNDRNGIFVA
ncbi:MAG TPA: VCBS repeat-containing protein [Gemmataceae bacterium]|jgi:hypothetical protein|nr:VCBS repeat-containing protein [Gemmataceae bacterium]